MNPTTPTKLAVVIKGGAVQEILANDSRVEVVLVDFDCQGSGVVDPVEGIYRLNDSLCEIAPLPVHCNPQKLATILSKLED